jgi:hypothetical protein
MKREEKRRGERRGAEVKGQGVQRENLHFYPQAAPCVYEDATVHVQYVELKGRQI